MREHLKNLGVPHDAPLPKDFVAPEAETENSQVVIRDSYDSLYQVKKMMGAGILDTTVPAAKSTIIDAIIRSSTIHDLRSTFCDNALEKIFHREFDRPFVWIQYNDDMFVYGSLYAEKIYDFLVPEVVSAHDAANGELFDGFPLNIVAEIVDLEEVKEKSNDIFSRVRMGDSLSRSFLGMTHASHLSVSDFLIVNDEGRIVDVKDIRDIPKGIDEDESSQASLELSTV